MKFNQLFLMMSIILSVTACQSSGSGDDPAPEPESSLSLSTEEEPTTTLNDETSIFESTLSYDSQLATLDSLGYHVNQNTSDSVTIQEVRLENAPENVSFQVMTEDIDHPCWNPNTQEGATLTPGQNCRLKAQISSTAAQEVTSSLIIDLSQGKPVSHGLNISFVDRQTAESDPAILPTITLLNDPVIVPSSKVEIKVKNTSDKQVNHLQLVLPDYLEDIAQDKNLSYPTGLNPNEEATLSFELDGSANTVSVLETHEANLANNTTSQELYLKGANLLHFHPPLDALTKPVKRPDNASSLTNMTQPVNENLTFYNASSNTVDFSNAAISSGGLNGITIAQDDCSNSPLAGHESCQITLDITSSAQGSGDLSLDYQTNTGHAFSVKPLDISIDNNLSPEQIQLDGSNSIIQPQSNTPITTTLTLVNHGVFDWQPSSDTNDYTFDDATGLTVTSGSCLDGGSIAPNASCTIEIQADQNASVGSNNLNIAATNNLSSQKTIPVNITEDNLNIDLASTNMLPETIGVDLTARFKVLVSNHSSASDNVTVNNVTLDSGSVFTIDTQESTCANGTTLAPGDACTVWLMATSSTTGDFNDTLMVDTDDPVTQQLSQPLSMTVVQQDSGELAQVNLTDTPTIAPGTTTNFTIDNTSNQPLNHVQLNLPSWLQDFVNTDDLVLQEDLAPTESHTFSFALPDNDTTESLIQSNYQALIDNPNSNEITITASNMQPIAPSLDVSVIPGGLSQKTVNINQRTTAETVDFVNDSNDTLTINTIDQTSLPDGISIDTVDSTCQADGSVEPNGSCQIKFEADQSAIGDGSLTIHYSNSNGKSHSSTASVVVGDVDVQLQDNALIDKPEEGSTDPVETSLTIENNGPFNWQPSTDAANYQVLANVSEGIEPDGISIATDTAKSTCLSGNTVNVGGTCALTFIVDSDSVESTSYDLKLLEDNNLKSAYRDTFTVRANEPSFNSDINSSVNHLRLKAIQVINNGSASGDFTYTLNDANGNFEVWNGQNNAWCTTTTCPNSCDTNLANIPLSVDEECNLYVHDANQATTSSPSLSATLSVNNDQLNDTYDLESTAYMYAGTYEDAPIELYRAPFNNLSGSWETVASFPDDFSSVNGLVASTNGDIYAGSNTSSKVVSLTNTNTPTFEQIATLPLSTGTGVFYTDANNILYIGTQSGIVYKTTLPDLDTFTNISNGDQVSGEIVFGLAKKDDTLYATTRKDMSIYKLIDNSWTSAFTDMTTKSRSFVIHGEKAYQGGSDLSVYSTAFPLSDNNLTQVGGAKIDGSTDNNNVYGLIVEADNDIYSVSINERALYHYDGTNWQAINTTLPNRFIRLLKNAEMTVTKQAK